MRNSTFIDGLCETLTETDKKRELAFKFVNAQLSLMPDYLKTGVSVSTFVVKTLALLYFFKPFHLVHIERRRVILNKIRSKNIPILGDLLKFYHSLVLLISNETGK